MENDKITHKELKETLANKGIVSLSTQERVIDKLQVLGSLVVMVSDVLDTLINDELEMMRILNVQYKQEQKMHKNQMLAAAKKFHYHMEGLGKNLFGSDKQAELEDNAQDIYEIIKLLADHTNNHKDYEVIKKSLRRRKLNHHIFE